MYDFLEAFVVAWALVEVPLGIWLVRAWPSREVLAKYPRRIRHLSHMPFGDKWKMQVEIEDLHILERFQWRVRVWYLSLILPFAFVFSLLAMDAFLLQ